MPPSPPGQAFIFLFVVAEKGVFLRFRQEETKEFFNNAWQMMSAYLIVYCFLIF